MGFYGERVLPRILNATCGTKAVEPLRRRVCGGLAGDVVEIGFGSGLNVPFYPAAVTRVAAVEPSDVGWNLAAGRGTLHFLEHGRLASTLAAAVIQIWTPPGRPQ